MNIAVRAACEAAAWAFAGVFLGLWLVAIFVSLSIPLEDLAAITAVLGLVGAVTAFFAVATLVRVRFPTKRPVVGARRGAAIGALVVVVVPAALVASQSFGRSGFLYSLFAAVSWSLVVGGLPFAVVGAVLGRWMDRRLFSSHGA
jgi:hypothetical protein